jgi:hypothetical protein
VSLVLKVLLNIPQQASLTFAVVKATPAYLEVAAPLSPQLASHQLHYKKWFVFRPLKVGLQSKLKPSR